VSGRSPLDQLLLVFVILKVILVVAELKPADCLTVKSKLPSCSLYLHPWTYMGRRIEARKLGIAETPDREVGRVHVEISRRSAL
jgi:hypothetical protein